MPDRARPWRILDLGLGSGCLLLTLLREYPQAQRRRPRGLGRGAGGGAGRMPKRWAWPTRARLIAGDWRRPGWARGAGRAVRSGGVQPALYRGRDDRAADAGGRPLRAAAGAGWRRRTGFDAYRAIAAAAPEIGHSRAASSLVEVGEGQATEISRIFAAAGLTPQAALEGSGRHRTGCRRRQLTALKGWQSSGLRLRFRLPLEGAWPGLRVPRATIPRTIEPRRRPGEGRG